MKPTVKPKNQNYSSGPCAKHPGFALDELSSALLGRSHRSKEGLARIKYLLDLTKELLGIPDDYLIGMVPGSDTGAMELAMWNLLGARGVDVIAYESFGSTWANDLKKELKLSDLRIFSAEYGKLPDLSGVDFERDVVFPWNGTTSGVKIPDGEWIPADREGLTIVDATSAVFAMELPWDKIDVATFSWQKVLGGEAGHGMLGLSPRAVDRLENYSAPWPLPKVFRIKKNGKVDLHVFEGSTINTPSMLCVEDFIKALQWAQSVGGLKGLVARCDENLRIMKRFVADHDWIDFLAEDEKTRSNTSVCLKVDATQEKLNGIVKILEEENVAVDCKSYRDAPLGLRFWCGATIDGEDIAVVLQWLEWAYGEVRA